MSTEILIPWASEPSRKTKIIGDDESGKLEMPVYGCLTAYESSCWEAMEDSRKDLTITMITLAQKIANNKSILNSLREEYKKSGKEPLKRGIDPVGESIYYITQLEESSLLQYIGNFADEFTVLLRSQDSATDVLIRKALPVLQSRLGLTTLTEEILKTPNAVKGMNTTLLAYIVAFAEEEQATDQGKRKTLAESNKQGIAKMLVGMPSSSNGENSSEPTGDDSTP